MSKGLLTLLLVLIIAYSLSFIPLNSNLINFDFIEEIFTRENVPAETVEPHTFDFYEGPSESKNIINLYMTTDNLDYTMNTELIVDVYKEDVPVKEYVSNELITAISENNDAENITTIFTLDLNLIESDITSGTYAIKIHSKDENYSAFILENTISFYEEFYYVGSSDTVAVGNEYIKLYFADESFNYLIPVSRLVPETEKDIRTLINNLYEGAKTNSGLYNGSIVPWSSRATLHDATLDMYFNSVDVKPFGAGSASAYFATNAILKTMTSLSYIKDIQFYIDNRIPPADADYFHGMVLNEPLTPIVSPKIYLGLLTSVEKVYLNEIELGDLKYEDVFDALKGYNELLSYVYEDSHTLLPIPESVSLMAINLDNGILTVNLSKEASTAYGNMSANYQMMVDAILYSYTSFNNIDQVQILIEGEKINDFYGYNFSNPLKANDYINIEH
ncbi:MAG: GerMN domain-containing protein [Clostridiales bacterium]|nr:GerMN domain-containing protein [Clostridiales bacterium]